MGELRSRPEMVTPISRATSRTTSSLRSEWSELLQLFGPSSNARWSLLSVSMDETTVQVITFPLTPFLHCARLVRGCATKESSKRGNNEKSLIFLVVKTFSFSNNRKPLVFLVASLRSATTMARWEDKNFKDLSVLIKIRRNFWLTGQAFRLLSFFARRKVGRERCH